MFLPLDFWIEFSELDVYIYIHVQVTKDMVVTAVQHEVMWPKDIRMFASSMKEEVCSLEVIWGL